MIIYFWIPKSLKASDLHRASISVLAKSGVLSKYSEEAVHAEQYLTSIVVP
jgi:hypothetical protein